MIHSTSKFIAQFKSLLVLSFLIIGLNNSFCYATPVHDNQEVTQPYRLILIDKAIVDKGIIENAIDFSGNVILKEIDSKFPLANQIQDIEKDIFGIEFQTVSIFSHGHKGEIQLGGSSIAAEGISEHDAFFKTINQLTNKNSTINFYACEAAKGIEGDDLFHALTGILDAKVALSDNLTGVSGDWNLEVAEDFAVQSGLDLAYLSDHYTSNLQGIINSPYCISEFSSFSDKATEMTVDWANNLIYFAGENRHGRLYRVNSAGTTVRIASNFVNIVSDELLYSWVSTDIVYYDDFIFTNVDGSLIKVDLSSAPPVSSIPYVFSGDLGGETGMAVIGDKVYTTDGKGTENAIYEYDIATNTAQVVVSGLPSDTLQGLEYCAATEKLYMAISPLGIYEVDVLAGTYNLVTDPLPNDSRSNFAVDPTGAYAFVHNGSTVHRYDLATGIGEVFVSGLVASNFCDLKFGPSSKDNTIYSLYIGGNYRIYEVTGFVAATPADTPTLISSETTLCPLDPQATSISISAEDKLNGASSWYLYAGSCGGTVIASNKTGVFSVTPLSTTTYYVRGEGECNVVPGECGSITINFSNLRPPITSVIPVVCNGESNGEIEVFASGGIAPYEYSIDSGANFQSENIFTALAAGEYWVVVKEGNGCTNIDLVELIEPEPLSYAYIVSDITCFGSVDGFIKITASGGYSAGYEYSIDGGSTWQLSNTFLNLAPATYAVVIRDRVYHYPVKDKKTNASESCETPPILVSIVEPEKIIFSNTQINVSCNGGNDGSIGFSAQGGSSGTFQYSIDGINYQDEASFEGLIAGSYQTAVRDRENISCVMPGDIITITEPTAITFTTSQSNISCFGDTNGRIVVAAVGGVGGTGSGILNYSKDGGVIWQLSNTFDNLIIGNYPIVVRDQGQPECQTPPQIVTITGPTQLSFTITSVNVSCNGEHDGQIIFNASGGIGGDGSGTYEYSIDGGYNWIDNATFNGLYAAKYQLILRDAVVQSCMTEMVDLEITEPEFLELSFTKLDAHCSTNNDGEIHLIAAGGTGGASSGTFEYTIGDDVWQDSGDFLGLSSADYFVAVRDKVNTSCETNTPNVFIDLISPVNLTYNFTDISCNGDNDGRIEMISGGASSYEYTIGADVWQDVGLFESLYAGEYQLITRDKINTACISTPVDLTLIEPTALTFTTAIIHATCDAGNDGEITVIASGGIGGEGSGTYEYSSDGTTFQDSNVFSGLVKANYSITIRDKVNTACVAPVKIIAIHEYSRVGVSVVTTDVSCFGGADGTISITATDGADYEYSIDNGANWIATSLFEGLMAGYDTIVVREAALPDCYTEPIVVVIEQPSPIGFTPSQTDVSCLGGNDGSIRITASGGVGGLGTGTYEYSKDGGTSWQPENTFTNLVVATYNIVVRDLGVPACQTDAQEVIITEPSALVFSLGKTDLTCFGAADGEITVTATGGTGGGASGIFEYSIDGTHWQDSNVFTGLDAIAYQVSVRDKNHTTCQASAQEIILGQPTELTFTSTITHATCGIDNDGEIILTASGGESGTYEYSIDGINWITTNTFSGLSADIYNAIIRDKVNTACNSAIEEIKIKSLSPIDYTFTYQDVSCPGGADGEIIFTATGGATYNYSIDDGGTWQASNIFSNLNGGNYLLVVRDQATPLCESETTAQELYEADELVVDYTVRNESCNADGDGRIEIIASGGASGTFQYSINGTDWDDNGLFDNLSAGNFNLLIRDKAFIDCVSVPQAVTLIKASAIDFEAIATPASCSGFNDGEILVNMTVGNQTAIYEYTNDNGANWQLSNAFPDLQAGIYYVGIREQGTSDCQSDFRSIVVSEPVKLNFQTQIKHESCDAENDGEIVIIPSGTFIGIPEYSINGGFDFYTSNTFTGIGVGSYAVFVRDSGSPDCTSDQQIVIIEKRSNLSFLTEKTNPICNGGTDGTIIVRLGIGLNIADYEFSNNDGLNWQDSNIFNGLAAGTYLVVIKKRGVNTCKSYPKTVVIGQPNEITMTVDLFPGDCDGGLGSIKIEVPAIFGTMLYSINNGSSYQTNKLFGDLGSGTYNVLVKNTTTGCIGQYEQNPIVLNLASELAVVISAPSENICSFYPIALSASGTDIESYLWSTGETTESIVYTALSAGIYYFTVDVVSIYGCTSSDEISLDFSAGSQINISALPNDTVCAKDEIELIALADNAVSYLWNPGDLTSGTVNIKYDDAGSYMYYIEVTNNIGCISMDSIQLVFKDCTGLNELDTDGVEISVFPNPSHNGQFKLEISGLKEEVDVWIIDFDGRLILEDKLQYKNTPTLQKQFDLQRFGRGVYFIRVATDDKVSYKRVVLM